MIRSWTGLALLALVAAGSPAEAQNKRLRTRQVEETAWTDRHPASPLEAQTKRHLWSSAVLNAVPNDYETAKRTYWVFVPKRYKKSKRRPYGLLVWITPGGRGVVPPMWEPTLQKKRMLAVGPDGVGNGQPLPVRIGRALDAAHNVIKRYSIDPERVYVAGFSGGANVACHLTLHYPELFRGGLYVGGCDSYTKVPVPGKPNSYWRGSIATPTPARLELAQERTRHVYQAGEDDPPAALQAKAMSALAVDLGFKRVLHVLVKKLPHVVPDNKVFAKCFKFLDDPKATTPAPKPAKKPKTDKPDKTNKTDKRPKPE